MPDFNSGFNFNSNQEDNGFFWNGMEYIIYVNLNETLKQSDEITEQIAKFILSENLNAVYSLVLQTALYGISDSFSATEDSHMYRLFELMEEFGIKDEFSDLIVLAHLFELPNIVDEAKMLNAIISVDDDFNFWGDNRTRDVEGFGEKIDITALYNIAEKYNLNDIINYIKIIHNLHENMKWSDEEPDPIAAMTDWLLGVSGTLDTAYDWFLPFKLKVDWSETNVQVMPEAEVTTVEVPGVDGSLPVDTVYKDRLFNIVAYSEQGLTVQQKEELKAKIANLLASTKEEPKKLAVQPRNIAFDVRYNGQAEITEANSWVKAKIPLMVSTYGRNFYDNVIIGSGLIYNKGAIATGPRHIISGPCNPFSYTLDGETYRYTQYIPYGSKLFIDNDMKSIWVENENGVKTNTLRYFSGKFKKIPALSSAVLTVPESIKYNFRTEWLDRVLW